MPDTPAPYLDELDYVRDEGHPAPLPPSPALADAMAELTDDGDTFDLAGPFSLRLTLSPDAYYSVNDYDADGRVEWTRNNDYGPQRPDEFTGCARIIDRDRGSSLWWEPPGEELIGPEPWTDEQMRAEEARVVELCRYGFTMVRLSLIETTTDSRGHEHAVTVDDEYLGGVDQMYPDLICGMADELAQRNPAACRPRPATVATLSGKPGTSLICSSYGEAHGTWSATPADYFLRDPAEPFTCDCRAPLIEVRRFTSFRQVAP